MSAQEKAKTLLHEAGITLNGRSPWDIQVKNDKLFNRVFAQGSLGFGEAYMDSWFEVKELDSFFTKIFKAQLEKKIEPLSMMLTILKAKLLNQQSKKRAFIIGEEHYDTGNDLYEAMLDKRMVYTCGYWKNAKTLDKAQKDKLDLVCRKIGLKKGMKVLDIGCGWGSFAAYAAKHYGAKVVGITVSKEQVKLAKKRCKGLPVEIRLQDYRDVNEEFDRIISLGMFEHVGVKNYDTYMDVARRCLKDDGLFLLHTIGSNISNNTTDPWIEKYIFPNSMLPSLAQISKACEKRFVIEDVHNFGADYDKTLMAWFKNFDAAWPKLKEHYSQRFYRMWTFYLLSCAGGFRARKLQLWQIVLSKNGVKGGYTSLR